MSFGRMGMMFLGVMLFGLASLGLMGLSMHSPSLWRASQNSTEVQQLRDTVGQLRAYVSELKQASAEGTAVVPRSSPVAPEAQPPKLPEQSAVTDGSDKVLCILMAPPLQPKEVSKFWKLVGIYGQHCDGVRVAVTKAFFGVEHPAAVLKQSNASGNVFVSVLEMPHAPESKKNLFEKTYMSFLFSYEHELHKYGWFVGQNTDALLCAENLKHLIKEHSWDPAKPHYLGHILRHQAVPFNAGGIYVLSRGALAKYGPKTKALAKSKRMGYTGSSCYDTATQDEDVMLGLCLKAVGVAPTHTHDSKGRDAFFNFRLADHHKLTWARDWFWRGKDKKLVKDCCQEYPVAAHNFKDLDEHVQVLTRLYSRGFSKTGLVSKLDWLMAEGCVGLGPKTKFKDRSECP